MKVSEIKIGETYNGVKVLDDLGYHKGGRRYLCLCPRCGCTFEVQQYKVGISKTCRSCYIERGCDNMIGQKYGRLIVKSFSHSEDSHAFVKCVCDCGNETTVMANRLKLKETQSCGCLVKDRLNELARSKCTYVSIEFNYNDRITNHPLFHIWYGMLSRCHNSNNSVYRNYGRRGIKVCDRWLPKNKGFENFIADMGERPSKKHSIDRIDVNGDYCPENCRWATQEEQSNNKRVNVFVFYNNEKMTVAQFCRKYDIKSAGTLYTQLHKGVDINYVISTMKKWKGLFPKTKRSINGNKIITLKLQ